MDQNILNMSVPESKDEKKPEIIEKKRRGRPKTVITPEQKEQQKLKQKATMKRWYENNIEKVRSYRKAHKADVDKTEKKFYCELCDRTLSTKYAYKYHIELSSTHLKKLASLKAR